MKRLQGKRIALYLFLFTTLSSAVLFAYVLHSMKDFQFVIELETIILFTWVCSLSSLFVQKIQWFAVIHFFRACVLLIEFVPIVQRNTLLSIMVPAPFIWETAMYLDAFSASAVSAIVIIVGNILIVQFVNVDRIDSVVLCAGWSIILCATASIGVLMTRYRETLVGLTARKEELQTALLSLEKANLSYQDYAEKIESLSEDNERHRITREIHDTIGYALTNIGMLMQAGKAVAQKDPGRLNEILETAREEAKTALQESRNILYKLRSQLRLRRIGSDAVLHLAKALRDATGIEVDVSFGNAPGSFGRDIDESVFRLVQEGITNAIKHGQATRIAISYWVGDADLQIRVWDNGNGAAETADGIGLTGMRERFSAINGRIEAKNVVDGFVLTAYIPLEVIKDAAKQR
ncbi:MAG: sensor histidine kinase [Treponemataceae bacterium]